MNVTNEGPMRWELEAHKELRGTFCCVQEHRRRGEERKGLEEWTAKIGYSCVAGEAYVKNTGNGGGTVVLGPWCGGVRPAPGGKDVVEGRATVAIANLEGSVAIGSVYGVSGGGVAKQLKIWERLARYLRTLGIPFAIGGD